VDTRPLPTTRVVLGRYRLGSVIGRGGTAMVCAGEDLRSGARVAVKEISDPTMAPRALSEVRAGARLRHPSIVPILDWGHEDDGLVIVSDLVEGPSLSARLASGRPVGDAEAIEIARAVLGGLAHAHDRGVVHRDVKPGNILLDPVEGARLTDFGIARLSGEATMTMTGAVIGTMAYMAPEQALGHRVGAPADVYSACLVLFEMLAGRNPIAGGGPAATARRAASADVPSLAGMRPDLPRPITDAVMRGLARDPDRRPSAAGLRDALRGGGGLARRTRAMARGGGLVSAAGAGALVWLGAGAATGLGSLEVAALAAAAAVLGAWHPRTALLLAGGLGLVAAGRWSPGAAALIAALAMVVAVPAIGARRLMMAPAGAPALAAAGLVPLYPAGCAMIRGVAMRAWLGVAGVLALLVWEITHAGGVLVDAATATGIADELAGERSPVVAANQVVEGLGGDLGLLLRCGVLVGAALLARPLLAGPIRTRLLGAGAWCALVAAGLAATSPDPVDAAAAAVPGAIIVLAVAARPWRHLPGRAAHPPSATLHDPT